MDIQIRPALVTLEGGEGVGKSTQALAVAAALRDRGVTVVATREPGGTPLGEAVRRVILEAPAAPDILAEALLFAAARREHLARVIEPAIAAGALVLCDRFIDSTRVYQGVLGGLPPATIEAVIGLATAGRAPDLTLVLDLATEAGQGRLAGRAGPSTRFDDMADHAHERVRQAFLAIADAEPARCAVIDAGRAPAQVTSAILAAIETRLAARAEAR